MRTITTIFCLLSLVSCASSPVVPMEERRVLYIKQACPTELGDGLADCFEKAFNEFNSQEAVQERRENMSHFDSRR